MEPYVFSEGTSNKFWEISVSGNVLTTRWGRIGGAGQSKSTTFKDAAAAQREHDKLVAEKLRKGYQLESGRGAAGAAAKKKTTKAKPPAAATKAGGRAKAGNATKPDKSASDWWKKIGWACDTKSNSLYHKDDAPDENPFDDKLLAKVGDLLVEDVSSLQEIPLAKMPALKRLTINYPERGQARLSSLEGVELAPKLEELEAEGHGLTDISPVAKLSGLRKLNVRHNKIRDLAPLGACKKLEEASLSDNRIADVGPLASLTRLTHVFIDNNPVRDIAAVMSLPKLEHLSIPVKVPTEQVEKLRSSKKKLQISF
ncbi:MAG: WGR domain-containing protein [Myxococcaceae bacterium]|nr:WGR domain-containing protein [Myxococcaceae bacterium]